MIMQILKNVTFGSIYLHLPCFKKDGVEIRPELFSLTHQIPS